MYRTLFHQMFPSKCINGQVLLMHKRQLSSPSHSIKQLLGSAATVRGNVSACGWVRNIRRLKNAVFLDLEDGSCSQRLQVVLKAESIKGMDLSAGCSMIIEGTLEPNAREANKVELIANSALVIGGCPIADYPFRPKKHYTADYTREFLHLRPRTKSFASLLRLRSSCYKSIHDFFQKEAFFHVHTPIITANDCEGAGEVFTLSPVTKPENGDFFDVPVYLTVSSQLHLESAMFGLSKVYTCNPTFRAENSRSRKHLSEFYMIEAEQAFVNSIQEIMDLVERLIKYVTQNGFTTHEGDLQIVTERTKFEHERFKEKVLSLPFPRISYTEAIKILQGKQNSVKIVHGQDLKSEHEQLLIEHFDHLPVFITHFPSNIKPFYMKKDSGSEFAECFDLLAPIGGEICGGSIREHDEENLAKRLDELGLAETLKWYCDLRKFGSVPHGGFGMGFERYLQSILGIQNIKDVIPFPRWPHHCHM